VAMSSAVEVTNLSNIRSAIYMGNPRDQRSCFIRGRQIPHPMAGARLFLGSQIGQRDFWNGYIRSVSLNGNWLSRGMWRSVRTVPDFKPTYADADKLRPALLQAIAKL